MEALQQAADGESRKTISSLAGVDKLIANIIAEWGEPAYSFIKQHLDISSQSTLVISTTARFNLKILPADAYNGIANLRRINDIQFLNKFFETVNEMLPEGGVFIGFGETKAFRKKKILKKFPFGVNYLVYSIDFVFTRIFPKLPITKEL